MKNMINNSHEGEYFIQCACSTPGHAAIFMLDKTDQELFLYTQLETHQPFRRRLWYAIKYIFGYKSKYGHWEETILHILDIKQLHGILDQFLKDVNPNAKAKIKQGLKEAKDKKVLL